MILLRLQNVGSDVTIPKSKKAAQLVSGLLPIFGPWKSLYKGGVYTACAVVNPLQNELMVQ
jgi:hypothetical protein